MKLKKRIANIAYITAIVLSGLSAYLLSPIDSMGLWTATTGVVLIIVIVEFGVNHRLNNFVYKIVKNKHKAD